MSGRKNFAAGVHELSFDLGIFKPIERAAGDEQEIMAGGHKFLMVAKNFAKAAFGAGAPDGVADGGAGSHHAQAGGGGGHGFREVGPAGIPKHKGAAIMAAPVGPDVLEIQLAPQTLLGAETHDREGNATPEGGRSLDDGQPFAAFATTVCEDRTATFGGFTGKETDLAGAF
jgi:hypothetical protein